MVKRIFCVNFMRKNYDQLIRTKRYRKLLKLYGSTKDKKKREDLADQLNEMQKAYNVTWDHCRKSMIPIGRKYGINAVFALTKAEDVWRGIENCLYGKGVIGADIGTQTVAYTSDTEVGLKNLSERGNSIQTSERKERLLYRAMDRSRRAANPQNYNEDGTVKKGRKTWKYSNHYKKLKAKHSELCRINAVNRQLVINDDANHLRSLGDTFVTEPKNASKLMKRAKEAAVNDKGRFNKKKRFGKSIKNRCPSGFQTTVEKKFKTTGGTYIEVPNNYRASQYDHTVDDYIKKKLSDRLYKLQDRTEVQRYKGIGIHHSCFTVTTIRYRI